MDTKVNCSISRNTKFHEKLKFISRNFVKRHVTKTLELNLFQISYILQVYIKDIENFAAKFRIHPTTDAPCMSKNFLPNAKPVYVIGNAGFFL
jgi:hypothetical protein